MVDNPSSAKAYRGEGDADKVTTSQEAINAAHSSDPANITDETFEYDEDMMGEAAEAFEHFGTYPIVTDGGYNQDPESRAGVTMNRPGNSLEDYDPEERGFEPHDEGPNYGEWANGFEDEEALKVFSGLFQK